MKPATSAQALVVSGYLGAGKTTLVRSLLEQGQREGIRTAVVSNEFGDLGIDEALLASSADMIELTGGCVCCRLSDDLVRTLQTLWERARPDRVIVETSGVALPYDTLINFWRDPVRAWATDELAVVVASAVQLAEERDLDATFQDQVCSADLVVLSKVDLVEPAALGRALTRLEAMQPGLEVVRSARGRVDSRLLFPPPSAEEPASRTRKPPPERAHPHHEDEFESREIVVAAGVDPAELAESLQRRRATRVKGFVETAAGLRLVQGVGGHVEVSAPERTPPPQLVGRLVAIERKRSAKGETSR